MKTVSVPATEDFNLETDQSRGVLAKTVINLFRHWSLSTADQLNLLGMSQHSRSMLTKYGKGEPLAISRDTLDRVGWLLSIHKALRLLYPQNETIRYSWVTSRNTAFDNHTPLEVMKEQGIIGIARVARYLDFVRGR